MFLISPTEHALADMGETSSIPETYGADILIPGNGMLVGVQRKVFPGDFISSLHDGRLSTSLVKLTKCDVRVMVLEGRPAWTTSGFLVSDHVQFARSQLRGLLLSASEELQVHTEWTDNKSDTVDYLRDLARWAQKERHDSLFNRPNDKPVYKRKWDVRDQAIFFLQGFEGVGPELAKKIYDHFGRIPLKWDVTDEELAAVDRMGPKKVAKLKEIVK